MNTLLVIVGAIVLFAAVKFFGVIGLLIAVGIMALLYAGGRNGQFLNICTVSVWYLDAERDAHTMDTPPDYS